MEKFNNKIVVITGASSGIGAETAKEFASRGALVLLIARNEINLRKVADQIQNNGGRAEIFPTDVSDYIAVKETAEKIKSNIGVPDIIFNNAGSGEWKFIEETEYQEAVAMIYVPYLAAFFITKAFMPEMLKRNSGHIINITSAAAFTPYAGATSYIAARKAMLGFHEAMTADLYHTNIKTSLVYFAKVESAYWQHNPGSEQRLPKAQKIIKVISATKAAQTIVNGVAKGKRKISAPFMLKVIEFLNYLNPFMTRFIMNKTGYQRKTNF